MYGLLLYYICIALAATAKAQDNLVLNPGFEDGVESWYFTSSIGGGISYIKSDHPNSGHNAYWVGGVDGNPMDFSLSQSFESITQNYYSLTAQVRWENASAVCEDVQSSICAIPNGDDSCDCCTMVLCFGDVCTTGYLQYVDLDKGKGYQELFTEGQIGGDGFSVSMSSQNGNICKGQGLYFDDVVMEVYST